MAQLEVGPITDYLGEEELAEVVKALKRAGVKRLPAGEPESLVVAGDLDDDVLAEFLDRLDANDAAADMYLPADFDGTVDAGEIRVCSLQTLQDVLEELRDELGIDEDDDLDEDNGDDDVSDIELVDQQMRDFWRYFHDGAQEATERSVPLVIK